MLVVRVVLSVVSLVGGEFVGLELEGSLLRAMFCWTTGVLVT